MKRRLALLLLSFVLIAPLSEGATIIIVNKDPAGVGFNDPTPAAPVGGNSGTTLGQQRLNVFQHAATMWGAKFSTSMTIKIRANFGALECSPTGGVLGSAGPTSVSRDFTGVPHTSTWYPVALASALSGSDMASGLADGASISASFNSSLGTAGCLPGLTWYLGLDNNPGANQIVLLETVLHEFGHGLGFLSLVGLDDGALFNGFDDIFTRSMFDNSTSMRWSLMSNAQRLTSMTNNGNVVFDGSNVTSATSILSAGKDVGGHPKIYAPSSVEPGSSISHFDTTATPDQLMEPSDTPTVIPDVDLPHDLTMKVMRDLGWAQTAGVPCFTVTTAVAPSGSGSVAVGTAQNCAGGYTAGTAVQLTATAGAGATFANWGSSGGGSFSSTTTNPTTFTITGNTVVTANFTVPGTTTDVIANGGFESASATGNTAPGWTVTPAAGHNVIQKSAGFPRTGTAHAILGVSDNATESVRQTVTIPATATSATLSFFANVVTDEFLGGGVFDALYVEFLTTGGSFVATAVVLTNEHAANSSDTNGVYFGVNVNVLPLAGQTLQLRFQAENDSSFATTFRIDDVSLQVFTPGGGAAPAAPTNVVATAVSSSQVNVSWTAVAGATGYQVFRKSGGGAFVQVGTPATNSFPNSGLTANTAYVYQVKAVNGSGTSAASNNDLATTIVFTDDPLVTNTTTLKAVHLTQLRTAVNAARATAGLSAAVFTDAALAAGTGVRKVHIEELRTNLTTARAALSVPALTFTDSTLTTGSTQVKKLHVDELRNGVK